MSAAIKHDEVDALKSEFESLRADVASLTDSFQEFLKQQSARAGKGHEGKENVTSTDEADSEWEVLRQRLEAARAGGEQVVRELRSEVEQHPVASVGIALGLGYLLARLFK
ncbi:MAG: hypothetical protein LJE74_01345 [Proteobacteria bacterium]|jgi:ElaB/YqjD/DUF883 family membrane-anchored ribosome-binding protein|nr:hypothetical protein [Pseudomonadota bacterium]